MQINLEPSKSFQEQFSKEILLGERFRTIILAAVLVLPLLSTSLVTIFYFDAYPQLDNARFTIFWIPVIIFILIVRSLNINRIIKKRLEVGKNIHPSLRYSNAFFEISVPSVLIIFLAQAMEPAVYALITPLPYLYFLFIILSILDMDLKLCFFTGIIASAEYIALALYYLSNAQLSDGSVILQIPPFLGRGAFYLLAGVVSGLIADQIKKRIYHSYQVIDDRNRIEKLFGQQVSPAIVDEILKGKKEIVSRKRNVCIMFLDIRDFTPFSECKSPEEIIKYQNDVFSFMIETINRNNGIINQFMGDGFMATFGAPIASEVYCQDAVNAAVEIVNQVVDHNDRGLIPPTRIGIGLHTGEVVTGNVGTTQRKQYSITGNTVILASRLEQLNKQFKSSILISREVLDRLKLKNFSTKSLGDVQIKGRKEPLHVYQLA
jgi:adenylate cyclase